MSLITVLFPHKLRPKGDIMRTNFAWEMIRSVYFEYFGVFHCLRFRGLQNIPTEGPLIFAPNHVSYYDPPAIAAAIPSLTHFMAWEALFRFPPFGRFLRSVGALPVKLQSADKKAISQTLHILRNKEAIMIFPEGGRSADGTLRPFENGVVRVAIQTGASIIPVTITGAFDAWPLKHKLPRWGHPITVKFHPLIVARKTESRDEMMTAMGSLNEAIRRPILRRIGAWERLKRRTAGIRG